MPLPLFLRHAAHAVDCVVQFGGIFCVTPVQSSPVQTCLTYRTFVSLRSSCLLFMYPAGGRAPLLLSTQYYDPGDAAHAKDRLDGYNLDGRNISVLYAQVGKTIT